MGYIQGKIKKLYKPYRVILMNISAINTPSSSVTTNSQTREMQTASHTAPTPAPDIVKKSASQIADLKTAVSSLNNFAKSLNTSVTFNMDHSSGKVMIKIIDANTTQLIRQIPSEEALAAVQIINNISSNKATGVVINSIA